MLAICLMAMMFTSEVVNADTFGGQQVMLASDVGPAPPMMKNFTILGDSLSSMARTQQSIFSIVNPQNCHIERGGSNARSWIPTHESLEFTRAMTEPANLQDKEGIRAHSKCVQCLSSFDYRLPWLKLM